MFKNLGNCAEFQDGDGDFQFPTTMWAVLHIDIDTRFGKRAQLMRTVAGDRGTSSFGYVGLLFFPSGIISARSLALGASTP